MPPKTISRQAQDQKARVAAGRCVRCNKASQGKWYCATCTDVIDQARRAREGGTPWQPGKRGRPPLWFTKFVRKHGRDAAIEEAARRTKS